MKRKILRKRLDRFSLWVIVFGLSALFFYAVKRPTSEVLFWFTVAVTFLAVAAIIFRASFSIRDRVITYIWRKSNHINK